MRIKAYAKVNISLDIVGKREDGYHLLEMIMQSIDLYDELNIEKQKKDITIKCNKPYVPTDERNLAYKAAKLFIEKYHIDSGVNISIKKNIPVCAGLAGGSTDGAAVLKVMNKLFNVDASDEELMELGLKLGADVIGAIPHFEFTREYGVESIDKIFELAKKYNVLVDVHCDEIDDEQSRFLEVVATRALETGLKNKVTASHTTAMGSYNNAYTYKLFRLLKMSGINFVSNPLVNTHLQGRFDTYPKRRGITRVKELNEAGINVCFGHDDIFDPWYPMGTGNMLEVVHFGLHVCQMMGYDDINESLKFISTNSARTLNIEDKYGIEIGKPGNLILLNAESGYDAVRRRAEILYSIREGKVIAKTIPSKTFVSINEEKEVNFKR